MGEQNENSYTEMKVEKFSPSHMHHKNSEIFMKWDVDPRRRDADAEGKVNHQRME